MSNQTTDEAAELEKLRAKQKATFDFNSEVRKDRMNTQSEEPLMKMLNSFAKTVEATGPLLESLTRKLDAEATCATNKCSANSDNTNTQSCPQNLGNIDAMCKSIDKALANTKNSEERGVNQPIKVQKQINWLTSVQQACKMMNSDETKTDLYPLLSKPNVRIDDSSQQNVGSVNMSTNDQSNNEVSPPPSDKPTGIDGRIPQDVLDLARNKSCCGNKVTYIFA